MFLLAQTTIGGLIQARSFLKDHTTQASLQERPPQKCAQCHSDRLYEESNPEADDWGQGAVLPVSTAGGTSS